MGYFLYKQRRQTDNVLKVFCYLVDAAILKVMFTSSPISALSIESNTLLLHTATYDHNWWSHIPFSIAGLNKPQCWLFQHTNMCHQSCISVSKYVLLNLLPILYSKCKSPSNFIYTKTGHAIIFYTCNMNCKFPAQPVTSGTRKQHISVNRCFCAKLSSDFLINISSNVLVRAIDNAAITFGPTHLYLLTVQTKGFCLCVHMQ